MVDILQENKYPVSVLVDVVVNAASVLAVRDDFVDAKQADEVVAIGVQWTIVAGIHREDSFVFLQLFQESLAGHMFAVGPTCTAKAVFRRVAQNAHTLNSASPQR